MPKPFNHAAFQQALRGVQSDFERKIDAFCDDLDAAVMKNVGLFAQGKELMFIVDKYQTNVFEHVIATDSNRYKLKWSHEGDSRYILVSNISEVVVGGRGGPGGPKDL